MGLVRRGGRPYLYHSRRVDGRVVTLYLGSGAGAEDRAGELAGELARARELRDRVRASREALAAEGRLLDGLAGEARGLAHRAMEAAGFHRHKRGEWRLRRGAGIVGELEVRRGAGPPARVDDVAAAAEEVRAFIRSYLGDAMAGDPAGLPKVRRYFDEAEAASAGLPADSSPLATAIKIHGGDPAEAAEEAIIRRFAGEDLVAREAIRRRLTRFRSELAGPGPASPLVRVLVDRAALCWLAVHDAEARAIRVESGVGPEQAVPYHKQADRAHRRLLDVLKTLDLVRKKVPPGIQVNVMADRAAFVVGGPATASGGGVVREGPELEDDR